MQDFQYAAPDSVDEAVRLLSEHGAHARLLAGGTDLIVQLRENIIQADLVIDAKRIPDLMRVDVSPETGLHVGAGAPCLTLFEDERIRASYSALSDAARIIGGWQIQSRASIGGNLCNSSPAADCIAPLIVLHGICHIAGQHGRRTVAVDSFCTGPGSNVLQHDELLVAITMPPPTQRSGSAYQRFIPRNEMDIAVAGAATWVQLDKSGRTIEAARIALSAVAPTPILAIDAGKWLGGKPATESSFVEAGEIARAYADPIDDMRGTAEFRTHLVGVLTKRTLRDAVQRASATLQ